MLVQHLIDALERIAPTSLAEPWDNAGLIVGDPARAIDGGVLLTIDLTDAVLAEARELRCGAIIAYHPPVFHPIRRLRADSAAERIAFRAAEMGLAVYSPHTALDAATGGMSDWLADGLLDRRGVVKADRRALRPLVERPAMEEVKIVTFVPEASLEDLRSALASAGAGRIGRYEVCSFTTHGIGTFWGQEGTAPAVGAPGRLERAAEVRLEMVCSRKALALAIATLRQFHPYEEPAIDVYDLVGKPRRSAGMGRRLVLDQPASLQKLVDRLKTHLGIDAVKLAAARTSPATFVGVVPGAGAELAPLALADGCEVFVTGEMKHHEVLPLLHAGMSVLLAGHTNSERGYLPHLALRLAAECPDAPPGTFLVSKRDRSPFVWM